MRSENRRYVLRWVVYCYQIISTANARNRSTITDLFRRTRLRYVIFKSLSDLDDLHYTTHSMLLVEMSTKRLFDGI